MCLSVEEGGRSTYLKRTFYNTNERMRTKRYGWNFISDKHLAAANRERKNWKATKIINSIQPSFMFGFGILCIVILSSQEPIIISTNENFVFFFSLLGCFDIYQFIGWYRTRFHLMYVVSECGIFAEGKRSEKY